MALEHFFNSPGGLQLLTIIGLLANGIVYWLTHQNKSEIQKQSAKLETTTAKVDQLAAQTSIVPTAIINGTGDA